MVVIVGGLLVWAQSSSSTLMIVSTTYRSFENDVASKLSLKNVTTVTFDAKNALPTMQALLSASSVFVWADQPFGDGVALANLLADYVDMGGHVVIGMFSHQRISSASSASWSVQLCRNASDIAGRCHFSKSI